MRSRKWEASPLTPPSMRVSALFEAVLLIYRLKQPVLRCCRFVRYDLPCIVGASGALQTVKTGDRVRLDCGTGQVTIVSAVSAL